MAGPVVWPLDWHAVEEAGFRALPACHEERHDGAVWRASGRRNMRNSSVTLLEPLSGEVADILEQVVRFSAQHGIEPVLRLPSPVAEHTACLGLQAELSRLGWQALKPSLVLALAPEQAVSARGGGGGQLRPLALKDWLSAQGDARAEDPQARLLFEELMRAVGPGLQTWAWRDGHGGDQAFEDWHASAMLYDDGQTLGLLNMLVVPTARGKGVARRFLAALLANFAPARPPIWLQVQADNAAALALYRGAGFRELYGYCYWQPKKIS